jgi:hypothetical protein
MTVAPMHETTPQPRRKARIVLAAALAGLAVLRAGPAFAAPQAFNAHWAYGDDQVRIVGAIPAGSRCTASQVLVPVTASAVKAFKKLYGTIGGFDQDVSFVCKGTVYRGVSSCNVISARCVRPN